MKRPRTEVLFAGATAGVIGGTAMLLWATLHAAYVGWGASMPARLVGATLFGSPALTGGFGFVVWGVLVHVLASAAWGIAFAAIAPRRMEYGPAIVLAIAFAMGVLVATTFAILPAIDPVLRAHVSAAPANWLLMHVLYALGVAAAPALRRRNDPEQPLAQIIPLPLHRVRRAMP